MFAGGLARLAQLEPDVTFGSDLVVSTTIELIGVPLLGFSGPRADRLMTRPTRLVAVELPGDMCVLSA
jgi:glycine cleavage system pyridoxal-binding protein P